MHDREGDREEGDREEGGEAGRATWGGVAARATVFIRGEGKSVKPWSLDEALAAAARA